ncbi:hypothetical protein Tco_1521664, partial [Tanacetum coccineum]
MVVRGRWGDDGGGGGFGVMMMEERVGESDYGDRVDRVARSILGVGRKSPPENFSGGGATVVAGSGGGGGWPDTLGERERL